MHGSLVDAVQHSKLLIGNGLATANQTSYAVFSLDGTSAIDDDVLNHRIAANKAEQANILRFGQVDNHVADDVVLTVELTVVLVGSACTDWSMTNASHVDVGSQDSLSRKHRGIIFACRVDILSKPFQFRGCTNLVNAVLVLCGFVPSLGSTANEPSCCEQSKAEEFCFSHVVKIKLMNIDCLNFLPYRKCQQNTILTESRAKIYKY